PSPTGGRPTTGRPPFPLTTGRTARAAAESPADRPSRHRTPGQAGSYAGCGRGCRAATATVQRCTPYEHPPTATNPAAHRGGPGRPVLSVFHTGKAVPALV